MTDPANAAESRRRTLIFAIAAGGYLLTVFQRLCPAVLAADMMRDLAAGGAGIGLLGSAYFYPYAAMQLPTGLLVDSWGPRKTFAAFFGLAALGSIGLGLSDSLGAAVFFRVLVGAGVATVFVASLKLVAVWYRPDSFAAMAGLLLSMGGVGSLAATAPLAYVAAELGWRGSFVAVGAASAALAVAAYACIRNRPAGAPAETPRPAGERAAASLGRDITSVFAEPAFWPLAGWIFFGQAIPFAFGGLWGGPYLRHVHGFTLHQSGLALAMIALGLILGGPALGHVSGKIGRKPTLIATSAGQFLFMLPLVIFTADAPPILLYTACFGFGFCGTSAAGIAFTSAKELFALRIAGTSTGLLNIFPFTSGALFQPLLGWILEQSGRDPGGAFTAAGYRTAFAVLLCGAALSAACGMFARETLKKKQA